jgi:predicted transcriptional regulator
MQRAYYKRANDPEVAIIAQLMVESAIRARRFARTVDYNELLVVMVLLWGRSTAKPFDISSVANVLDLPRTTVKRTLDRLVKQGEFGIAVDGRRKVYFRTEESLRGVRGVEFDLCVIEHVRHIRRASALLSKMEGRTPVQ